MKKVLSLFLFAVLLSGCASHHLAGYDLKVSVGTTERESDRNETDRYIGGSATFHFNVGGR